MELLGRIAFAGRLPVSLGAVVSLEAAARRATDAASLAEAAVPGAR